MDNNTALPLAAVFDAVNFSFRYYTEIANMHYRETNQAKVDYSIENIVEEADKIIQLYVKYCSGAEVPAEKNKKLNNNL